MGIVIDRSLDNLETAIKQLSALVEELNKNIAKNTLSTREFLDNFRKNNNYSIDEIFKGSKTGEGLNANKKNSTEEEIKKREKSIKNPENIEQALEGAGYRMEGEFGNTFKNIQTLTYNTAISMRDNKLKYTSKIQNSAVAIWTFSV